MSHDRTQRSRLRIINSICSKIGLERKNPNSVEMTNRELLFIEAFICIAGNLARKKLEGLSVRDPRLDKMR